MTTVVQASLDECGARVMLMGQEGCGFIGHAKGSSHRSTKRTLRTGKHVARHCIALQQALRQLVRTFNALYE